ncbi:uncharacterized protein BDV17DRAFT_290310 [Aspergillus undulatus]|uniref:uncharacterized protein n=1 Tax=Aspergillus undulatus TaxID=1810928 RepID=UPI003CCD241C
MVSGTASPDTDGAYNGLVTWKIFCELPSTVKATDTIFQNQPSNMAFPYKRFLVLGATSDKHGEDKANAIVFDLSQTDQIPQFVKNVTTQSPDIDCVYYNAGTQRPYDLANGDGWDLKTFNEVHLNFTSAVTLVHAFLPFSKAKAKAKAKKESASFIL